MITIIVLLILAGVSIATLTGENGILTRASEAKEKTEEAKEEENRNLEISETIIEEIVDGAITARTIAETDNKNEYYGEVIKNYTVDMSVQDDDIQWKIFYAGTVGDETENNIYLIASDYVKFEYLPKGIDENGNITENKLTNGNTPYTAYWNRDNPTLLSLYSAGTQRIRNEKIKALNNDYFNIKKYTSTENNMKAIAYMLDTKAWSNYANKEYADYAIGGPTIEMLLKSYNEKYRLTGDKEYKARASSANGYQISKDGGKEWSNEYNSMLAEDTLYVIPSSKNGNSTANAYWLSSPSETYNYYLIGVYNSGMIRGNYYSIDDRRISTNSLFKI